MEKIKQFTSSYVTIPAENIDTDQIIPARFLKTINKAGLGDLAFYDWRYDEAGNPRPDFVLNQPHARGAQILVAGRNFGCGSSREHAPWALKGLGFKAVVSSYFADIFRSNALKNGLLPIQVDEYVITNLLNQRQGSLSVNLESQTLTLPNGQDVVFPIPPFAKHCLLHGVDELGFLLSAMHDITAYETAMATGDPYAVHQADGCP